MGGAGIPKEMEVNRRRVVCEWERLVCGREAIGESSMLRLIHRTAVLTRKCREDPVAPKNPGLKPLAGPNYGGFETPAGEEGRGTLARMRGLLA